VSPLGLVLGLRRRSGEEVSCRLAGSRVNDRSGPLEGNVVLDHHGLVGLLAG